MGTLEDWVVGAGVATPRVRTVGVGDPWGRLGWFPSRRSTPARARGAGGGAARGARGEDAIGDARAFVLRHGIAVEAARGGRVGHASARGGVVVRERVREGRGP